MIFFQTLNIRTNKLNEDEKQSHLANTDIRIKKTNHLD